MTLNVYFDKPFAEVTYCDGVNYFYRHWYVSNGLMAECEKKPTEDPEKFEYTLTNFWADAEHMKRCLGLRKGCTNIYSDYPLLMGIRINKKATPNWKEIVTALAAAFSEFYITITEKPIDDTYYDLGDGSF